MTSDETPREPREGAGAPSTRATGTTGDTGSADASPTRSGESPGQRWNGPPGPSQETGGKNGAPTEQHAQTRSSPPNGGGESRAPGRLPASTWLVMLIGATVHATALTLILFLSGPIITMGVLTGSAGTMIVTPVVALALAMFLFRAFQRMLATVGFPRPTVAMALFTAIVAVAFTASAVVPWALGLGESADGMLTAAGLTTVVVALLMLISRKTGVRWAAAVSAVVLGVAGVATWARSQAVPDPIVEEHQRINLDHEDETAVLDVQGWEPYRSEINEAVHADAGNTDGAGDQAAPEGDGQLSVFTAFYQDGNGGYLRTATWADERTAQDPQAVLRAWCDEEGAHCEDMEVEGADGPVVAQWETEEDEGSAETESPEELGAPDSVRYEYEPGRVVYLEPWREEPGRAAHQGPWTDGQDHDAGADGGPEAGATLGHTDFEAQELAGWVTQVRPAQEEDLLELAERTVEYIQGPEDVLTES